MPVQGTRRGASVVPQHQEPEAGASTQSEDSAGRVPAAVAPAGDRFVRPQMPVSHNDASLNTDLSGIIVNPAALPKHTLSADEILAAPTSRQGELVRRYCSFLSLHAGGALGATRSGKPAPQTIDRAGAKAEISTDTIKLTVDGETTTLDLETPLSRVMADAQLPLAMRAVERLLTAPTGVDLEAAKLSLFLLGGDGLLTRGGRTPLRDEEVFTNPKLLCWDFNGTVEKFGDGRTRGDLARTSRAMERRGATSLITTTIAPEKPEKFMVDSDVAFGGYYGKNEVRPTQGNKAYRGMAAAHGISPADAPHRMAIFGDSTTDIPSDLPGTVFFHNDAMTPAPAIELLLGQLDRLGQGSFLRGLEHAAGGLPGPSQSKNDLRLGDVIFDVQMRDASNDPYDHVWVPTVCHVRLPLEPRDMIAGLREIPSSSDLNARAHYQLLLEHLSDGLDEHHVPTVLLGVDETPGERTAVAATKRRLDHRLVELEAGREAAASLEALMGEPVEHKVLFQQVAALVALGDGAIAQDLPARVAKAPQVADQARPAMLAAIDTFAAQVRDALAALEPVAVPYYQGAPGGPSRARLERILKDPVPLSPKKQKMVLKTLLMARDNHVPGSREAVDWLSQHLDEAVKTTKQTIADRLEERRRLQPELDALCAQARAHAITRERTFSVIAATLEKIAD